MRVASPLLESLDHADRELLLERAVARTLSVGQSLYLAGEPARRAHVVVAGVIKLTARSRAGRATILDLATPGEMVGQVAALDGGPQPLDALAATRCEVVGLEADLLRSVVGRCPDAALTLAGSLARTLRSTYASAAERTNAAVPARLAGRLLELAHALGHVRDGALELELPLAQEDLGRLAGMCRESTCKTLRTFKQAGLLDYRGRHLRLLRPDALERIRTEGL